MQDGDHQGPSAPSPLADPPSAGASTAAAPEADRPKPRGGVLAWIRGHKIVTAAVVTLFLLATAAGAYGLYLNSLLGGVTYLPENSSPPEETRPEPTETGALTILLAGADNGPGADIAKSMAADEWPKDEHRSDTIMVLHLPEDRKKAYLLSIPRDSYVQIYDGNGEPVGKDKINSAFADYGPPGYISTVEHLVGIRMDHLAILDWAGFKDIVDALGGVTVYVPETTEPDPKLDDIVFEKGYNELDGETALKYVRSRVNFALQDIGRIDRQQNFLRAVVEKIDDTGMVTSPHAFSQTFKAIADNLTVDAEWDSGELRNFAWSVRNLQSKDLKAMSAPLDEADPFPTIDGVGSVVQLDVKAIRDLFEAMKDDEAGDYLRKHDDLLLGDPEDIE
jgi:LCP family protein required for cell wall assembly